MRFKRLWDLKRQESNESKILKVIVEWAIRKNVRYISDARRRLICKSRTLLLSLHFPYVSMMMHYSNDKLMNLDYFSHCSQTFWDVDSGFLNFEVWMYIVSLNVYALKKKKTDLIDVATCDVREKQKRKERTRYASHCCSQTFWFDVDIGFWILRCDLNVIVESSSSVRFLNVYVVFFKTV